MSVINRQSYLAELAKLLGFMSSWDRQAALDKYNALFDEAGDEAALIKMLGSPTHLAISLANSYVPTAAPPAAEAAEEDKPESPFAEFETPPEEEPAAPAAPEEELPAPEPEQETPAPKAGGRKLRPFGLILSIILGLAIGLPIALLLICIGIPLLAAGGAVIAADIAAVMAVVGLLSMVSDILVVVGAGLVAAALGLFLAWFGLWLSIALGQLWIGGVVLRACRAMSFKKEVAAQ